MTVWTVCVLLTMLFSTCARNLCYRFKKRSTIVCLKHFQTIDFKLHFSRRKYMLHSNAVPSVCNCDKKATSRKCPKQCIANKKGHEVHQWFISLFLLLAMILHNFLQCHLKSKLFSCSSSAPLISASIHV